MADSTLFRVDAEKLAIASRIDREALCPVSASASLSRPVPVPQPQYQSLVSSSSLSTNSDCFVDVTLNAIRGGAYTFFRVRFNVADKNDQSPEFSAPGCSAAAPPHSGLAYGVGGPYVVTVDENSRLGTEVPLPVAHDDDTPQFSVRNYSLTWTPSDPRPPFELRYVLLLTSNYTVPLSQLYFIAFTGQLSTRMLTRMSSRLECMSNVPANETGTA